MVMIEDTIASSKALYDAMVSPSDLSHDTTMDESLPASYGMPGSAASTKFASKRLAALDATLQTLTPKELAELRLHAALRADSVIVDLAHYALSKQRKQSEQREGVQ